ncbi:MAG TPA: lipopolysaccharide biosynthesis protein [Nitrospirota bacterium]|nr:lipopolysaccharide biosynthesis protein [Nitrospirota bacterium]
MISTLKQKAVSATIWSGIDTLARQGVQFGITLILARLLTPTDYGTVGLLAIFFGVSGVFINSGFSSALIQRQEISDVDLSSVFYFNVCIALLCTLLLCAAAPCIAAFYNMPVLTPLTRLMAASLFIGAFGSIQSTLLSKSLNFRRQCIISLAAVVVSGIVAVVLAWRNYGVWSLAISTVAGTCVTTLLLWLLSSWRPRLVFSVTSVRSLFRFGSFLLISGLLDTLFSRMNTLVIGKFYSPKDLGYYSRADGTQQLPASLLANIITRVAFPIFAAAHSDKELLRTGLSKAIKMVMMLNIPVMLGMVVTARLLVLVLFGKQWLPCVHYLQILCIGGIFWPLHVLNLDILTAQGHSNLFFRLEVIKKVIGIFILGTACFFGINAIAWSTVVIGVIAFGINAHYSGLFLNYGTFRQTVDLLPYLAASLIMAFCVWTASMLPLQAPLLLLSTQIMIGVAVYILVCFSFRLSTFIESIELMTTRLRNMSI